MWGCAVVSIPRTTISPLKRHRLLSGIRQYHVAEAIGRSGSWLASAERGGQTVSVEEARALSKVLRVPIRDLFPDGLPVVQKRRLPSSDSAHKGGR